MKNGEMNSYFDLTPKEREQLLKKAAKAAEKEQKELLRKYDLSLCASAQHDK